MPPTKQQMRSWIEGWKAAGTMLEALRDREIRDASTAAAIEMLDGAFKAALREIEPAPSSGLVIQQQLFRKLRPS